MTDLSVALGSLTLKNPIMTASGCCEYGLELGDFFPLSSIGAVVVKGLSLHPRAGNPIPRIAETPAGMLNSIGLQNVGIDAFLEEKLPELRERRATVIANIFGETSEEYRKLSDRCRQGGLDGIELNLSCPNVQKGGIEFGTDADTIREITSTCREVFPSSLWVKLTPNVTRIVPLAEAAKEGGADAVTCINTLRGMAIDVETGKPRLHTMFGGLSGPAIRPVALRFVHEVSRHVDMPVIGCGGISTVSDILEFLLAGASAVQVGTILFRDPTAPRRLLQELQTALADRKIDRLDQIIGKMKPHDTQ